MQLAGCLEPAILSAVLVGPGTCPAEGICHRNCDDVSVVVGRVDAWDVRSKLCHGSEDFLLGGTNCGKSFECVAEQGAVTVLDTFNKDVSIVKHEIPCIHFGRNCVFKEWIDSIRLTSVPESSLLRHPVYTLLYHIWAEFSTFHARDVDLFIKVPEVNNWLDNA